MSKLFKVTRTWVTKADSAADALEKSKNWRHDTTQVTKLEGDRWIDMTFCCKMDYDSRIADAHAVDKKETGVSELRNRIIKNLAKQIGFPPDLVFYEEEDEMKGGSCLFGFGTIQIDQGAFDPYFLRTWGISGPAEILAHEIAELQSGSVGGHGDADRLGASLPGLTQSQRWNLLHMKR